MFHRLSANLPPGQVHASSEGVLSDLTARMGPHFNVLSGNEELEAAYLAYEASVLDAEYDGQPDFRRIEQLPAHEQAQIQAMVQGLANLGLASPYILGKRLERIRIRNVDSHSAVTTEDVGGEFKNGLATVVHDPDPKMQNHALLHEIAHGLTVSGPIVLMGGMVLSTGRGLTSRRTTNGPMAPASTRGLHLAEESILDTLTLSVSDLDTKTYLAGTFPDRGYWREDNTLSALTTDKPDLVEAISRGVFATGLENAQQGLVFADAFLAAHSTRS
jgi:hypothetical protein